MIVIGGRVFGRDGTLFFAIGGYSWCIIVSEHSFSARAVPGGFKDRTTPRIRLSTDQVEGRVSRRPVVRKTNLDQGKRPRGARGFRDVGDTDRARIQAAAVAIESRQQSRERQK